MIVRGSLLAGLAIAALAAVGTSGTAAAQEFFAAKRDFLVTSACDATRSIRSQGDPVPLAVGTTYQGRGLNRATDPTHAFIVVEGRNKWVALGCGRFTDGGGPDVAAAPPSPGKGAPGAPGRPPSASVCLPFFDNVDNPETIGFGGRQDPSPKAPTLNDFDRDAAETCGAPGKVVSREEFKSLLRRHQPVLDRIRTFTGGKVFANKPARTTEVDFLNDLTEAWFAIKAFDHIFCGEPSTSGGSKIGGLHFHGRYLHLQEQGQACRMNNFAQNEIVPGSIYTMGVIMRMADGREVRDARKGYGYTLSAEELLKVVTRAFAENPSPSSESQGCLLPVADDGQKFKAVFVRRATGIRTFYPDATPNSRGDRINPACAREIALQP